MVSIVRWNLKEAGCEEYTNSRANLWSDEQKSHMRSCMWVRQQAMLKPDNYTESCMINEADGWRGRNVYIILNSTGILDDYIIKCYDVLHTQKI